MKKFSEYLPNFKFRAVNTPMERPASYLVDLYARDGSSHKFYFLVGQDSGMAWGPPGLDDYIKISYNGMNRIPDDYRDY